MRAVLIFKKCVRQQLRDRLGLALSLLTAPFFVILYWMFFSEQLITCNIIVCNKDITISSGSKMVNYGQEVINSMTKLTLEDGSNSFHVTVIDDPSKFKHALLNGKAIAGVIIPPKFSYAIENEHSIPATVSLTGNSTLPLYYVTKSLIKQILEEYDTKKSQFSPSIILVEKPLGLSTARTPFEAYVPGLLVFAVIMLIFSSSMAVAREIEARTLDRLKMTPVNSLDLLAGMSAVQIIQGLVSVLLTFMTAWILGFRSAGSMALAFIISGIACFASVGIGMIVASISRSQTRAFLISSVAMFMLILFSGIIFPRPEVNLLEIGSYSINLFDFLPTTHMGTGLEKLLTLGVSYFDVVYEIGALILLSFLYFGTGVFIFNRFGTTFSQ
ncbi:MAG: ABC transporter permease [Deltaproteobacteria bacterium]|nr:ABC transporter permease [Deltaproteobacteria bacterium]